MADETKTNATPEAPGGPPPPAPEQTEQAVIPGMDGGPAPSGKVIDLSDVRAEADKTGPEASAPGDVPPEQGAAGSVTEYTKQEWERPLEEIEAEQKKPRRGRPSKADRAAPEAGEKKTGKGRATKPKDKAAPGKTAKAPGKGKRAAPGKGAPPTPAKEEAPAPPPEPAQPRDATRAAKEEVVYLNLSDLHPFMDAGKLSFTPAVEISRIRPKHQKYIAVSIEGQQSSPSQGQAKRLRELDKDNKLNPDAIDAILSEEKKKEDISVIISGAELEKYFGKEATPRQMKDQIMALLDGWKEKQPPELGKGDKKVEMEK